MVKDVKLSLSKVFNIVELNQTAEGLGRLITPERNWNTLRFSQRDHKGGLHRSACKLNSGFSVAALQVLIPFPLFRIGMGTRNASSIALLGLHL